MRDDRPLDALVPGLRPGGGPRLLEVALDDGALAWVLAMDTAYGDPAAFVRAARQLLEGTILAHLSRPELGRAPKGGVHLLGYRATATDPARALAGFGLSPFTPAGPRWDEILATFGSGPPSWVLRAPLEVVPLAERLDEVLDAERPEPWGVVPGLPAARLLHLAHALGLPSLEPELAAIDALEAALVPRAPGHLRWLPPRVLQALADLMGVVAQRLGARVEWADATPEPDGYAPPPLFRLNGARHLPIGLHLLRWCVMPRGPREAIPPLSEWLAHEVAE